MDINYELYKVFYYVASTLSFSEASKQLFISQSAVSQSIKALEKKLDQTLFIREYQESPSYYRRRDPSAPHRTGDQPDQARRKPAPRCRRTRRTASYRSQVTRSARYFCRVNLILGNRFPPGIFPGAHIKVTNATSIRCVELLETGQVDLIVVNSPNSYLGNVPNVKKIKDFQDVFIGQ